MFNIDILSVKEKSMYKYIKNLFTELEPQSPTTFEEAVDFVALNIKKSTVTSPNFHLMGGMSIRNSLDLWNKNSVLSKHMQSRFGLCHADDLGSLITSAADAKVNGREYSPDNDVQKFKNHWEQQDIDPATMKRNNVDYDLNSDLISSLYEDWQDEDWHEDVGFERPNTQAMETTKHVVKKLKEHGLEFTDIDYSVDGGFCIKFFIDNKYADIECFNDGTMFSIISLEEFEDAWEVHNLDDAIVKIKQFLGDDCGH